MLAFLIRRLGLAALTLVIVTFLVYALIRNMPGSPLDTDPAFQSMDKPIRAEDYERLKKAYGLDKPWYIGYWGWAGSVLQLDLEKSLVQKEPVASLILQKAGPTLLLSVTSLLLSYILAIPIGLYSSAFAGAKRERITSALLYALYSLPGFVAALYMQLFLAVRWDLLPLEGMWTDGAEELSSFQRAWDLTKHALMPVIVYTYGSLAYYSRFVRANMQEALRQDYVRTARAKGLSEKTVVVKHAFRNTLIPLVTLIGLTLPGLLSGSIIIEQIFNWPGMGQFYFESILRRDYPAIMGLTLMFSVLTLAGQLLADILYAVVDPRVRLQ